VVRPAALGGARGAGWPRREQLRDCLPRRLRPLPRFPA